MRFSTLRNLSKNPRSLALWLTVLITVWILSGLFSSPEEPESSTGKTQEEAKVKEETERLSRILQVEHREAESKTSYVVLNGVTQPARITLLEAETESSVLKILVSDGDIVKAGQELVKLDTRDRIERVREADALVRQRQIEYAASLKLKEKGFQTEVGLANAVTQLEAAKLMLKKAKLDLSYTTIKAPYDGVVEDVMVEEGDLVGRGMSKQAVIRFVDLTPLKIMGQVSENELASIRKGSEAAIRLASGVESRGMVTYVATVAEQESRSFRVEIEVANEDGSIPAGVSAEISMPGIVRSAYLISAALLSLDDTGKVGVKTVDDTGLVEFHRVDVLSQSAEGVWISGLPDAVNLVTSGAAFVSAGQRIELGKYLTAEGGSATQPEITHD